MRERRKPARLRCRRVLDMSFGRKSRNSKEGKRRREVVLQNRAELSLW